MDIIKKILNTNLAGSILDGAAHQLGPHGHVMAAAGMIKIAEIVLGYWPFRCDQIIQANLQTRHGRDCIGIAARHPQTQHPEKLVLSLNNLIIHASSHQIAN